MNYFYDEDDDEGKIPNQTNDDEQSDLEDDGDEDEVEEGDGGNILDNLSKSESSGDENPGNEPSGNEQSGNEPSENEQSENEPSGNEQSENEPSGNEPSGDESSGNEPHRDETPKNETSGDKPTGGEESHGNKNVENKGSSPKSNAGNEGVKKAGEEGGKKALEEGGKKAGEEATKQAAKQAASQAASKAATSAATGAAGAGVMAYLVPILLGILAVLLVIILLVGIIMFFLTVPGMLAEKLGEFFSNFGKRLANIFLGQSTTEQIDPEEVYEILDYLEEMGYDLKGYGFLSQDADEDDADYDYEQGVIRKKSDKKIGKEKKDGETYKKDDSVVAAYSPIIVTYITSDNYVYTAKNFNKTGILGAISNFLGPLQEVIVNIGLGAAGTDQVQALGEGLISLYIDYGGYERPYEKNLFDQIFGTSTTWNDIDIDPDKKVLRIRRGWGANYMEYNLDGWSGRYGMPLEFLLSVQIATMKPDLAVSMVNEFATDVRILMKPTSANIESAYKRDHKNGVDYTPTGDQSEDYILYDDLWQIKSSGGNWPDSWFLSKEEALDILNAGIASPVNCTHSNDTRKVVAYSSKHKTNEEAVNDWFNEDIENDLGDDDLEFNIGDDGYTKREEINSDIGKDSALSDEARNGFEVKKSMIYAYKETDRWLAHTTLREQAESYGYKNPKNKTTGASDESFMFWDEVDYDYEDDTEDGENTNQLIVSVSPVETIQPDQGDSERVVKRTVNDVEMTVEYHMEAIEVEREWVKGETIYTWITYVWDIMGDNAYKNAAGHPYLARYYIDVILSEKISDRNKKDDDKKCHQVKQTYKNGDKNKPEKKACSNCRRHVKKIMKLLSKAHESDFDTYTPYIKQVTDHWFRNVYFELNSTQIEDVKLTTTDAQYEILTNERWTEYEKDDDYNDILYIYDEENERIATGNNGGKIYHTYQNGEKAIAVDKGNGSIFTIEETNGDKRTGTLEEAKEAGVRVIRKQKETYAVDLANRKEGTDKGAIKLSKDSRGNSYWTAYGTETTEDAEWIPLYEGDSDEVKQKLYYQTTTYNNVVQKQDGLRGVTNEKIKDMFLNRYYFSYDGTGEKAEIIQELRKAMTGDYNAYGEIKKEWLDDKYTIEIQRLESGTGNNQEEQLSYKTETLKDVRVGDYASKVSITQDSLAAFSILENTHTLDADFIYKDFKELIVELGYFDKEQLSDYTPQVLQFLIPTIASYGYPNPLIDKNENEYGTFLHSKLDYEAAEKASMQALIEKADATKSQQTTPDDGTLDESEQGQITDESNANVPESSVSTNTESENPDLR